ncbi:Conserved oligomeric golgi complex subunit [Globisporangium polare]
MGQRGRREQRHAELLARLADIQKQQQTLHTEALAFVADPAADEKLAVHKSLRELLLLTPEVTVLGAQTGGVVERIANANDVAEKMTREVRRIDIIQSRMSACLAQSSQLLNLRNAMVGIRRAMQHRNYPEAAKFLKELKAIEQLMSLDVADKLRMDTIENDLKGIIESSFDDGLRAGERNKIQTYAPLFQIVSQEYEERGFQQLLAYVKSSLDEQLSDMTKGSFSTREQMDHLTTIFNQIAAVSQEYDQLLTSCFARVSGPNRLVQAIYGIGEKFAGAVLSAYMQQRRFHERMQVSAAASEQQAVSNTATPRTSQNAQTMARGSLSPVNAGSEAVNMSSSHATDDEITVLNEQLNEVALVIQHTQTYERFMRSRVVAPIDEGTNNNNREQAAHVLPLSHESELGKTVQELAGYYCYFENDLLNKAARKAFQWEEIRHSSGSSSSSLPGAGDEVLTFPISSAIDEIFYVSRNSGLRALATGHVDCAAGVLNMINTVLRDALGDTMRSRIRNMAAHVRLVDTEDTAGLLGASSQLRDQMQQQLAKFSKNMGPIQLATTTAAVSGLAGATGATNSGQPELRKELGPDVVMNSLETTTEYIAQLKREFENELPQDFPDVPKHILTCLSGLEDSSAELTQLLVASRKKLCKLFEPKVISALGGLLTANSKRPAVHYELSEQMFTFNEANDPFAHHFVSCMRALLSPFRATLSAANYSSLVEIVAKCTTEIIEKWFSARNARFNQLGALQFDKDVRVLSAFFGEHCECREIFATLNQIASVLNVDAPDDVLDFFGRKARGVEWQLSAARVKEVLSRRIEFADAVINKLNLSL